MLRSGSTAARRASTSASEESGTSRTIDGSETSVTCGDGGGCGDGDDTAAGSSSNGRSGSNVADIILPADGGEGARLAAPDIVRGWRELSSRDGVDRIGEPLLGVGEDLGPLVGFRIQRHDATRTLEGEVHRLAERPPPLAVR